ncbi:MAG TPA: hypothetical protein VFA56_13620 [Gaiellaceae bacterium]|nr:hypothetical protein [Gaiellaceae bacterium]
MIQHDEGYTERFELVMRPSEKAAIVELARRNERSTAAELRVALAAWVREHEKDVA